MARTKFRLLILSLALVFVACKKEEAKNEAPKQELWIYTSLYKDTIADLTPRLAKAFPGVTFNWYQAGSEEIAAKVNGEMLAGGIKADVLISSDRFWYEELAALGTLHPFKALNWNDIPAGLKHSTAAFTTLSIPVMVLAYNKDAVKNPPKTYKELADPKWKGKITSGSPLNSGTNFTTLAMLQHRYGWEYVQGLRKNEIIAEGGNSGAIRRIQTAERPVGWVLLENMLRVVTEDPRMAIIYTEDGVVTQSNVLAIVKKDGDPALRERFSAWMFGPEGQEAMTRSFMYSPFVKIAPPEGAPSLSSLLPKSFQWTPEFVQATVKNRSTIKDKYTEIMFK
jgi:iron(III) transport system substrate-binding protein